jgi:uncharacterized protein YcbK (DUF882 family)
MNKEVSDLLEEMLNETIAVKVVESTFYQKYANYIKFDCSYLQHYFDDEDIRIKDKKYKLFQNDELKKLIYYLRNDNIRKAEAINFLEKTPDL